MQFHQVVLDALAYVIPRDQWTSERIEQQLAPTYQRLKLPFGRLEWMTGIRTRYHWAANDQPSKAAMQAGEKLLQQSVYQRSEIDVLIHAAVCRDRLEPATAAYVHAGLKLSPKTQIFDLSNACLGVLNAIVVGASMIEAGTARSVLIVSGENGKPLLDHTIQQLNTHPHLTRTRFKAAFANLTIGSGAVAILLRHRTDVATPKPLLLGGIARTDSSANTLCEGGATPEGIVMQTHASALLDAGIHLAQKAWNDFKSEMAWDEQTPHHIITHQVSLQHQKKLYEALHLNSNKNIATFQQFGNTGSVALPISLCHGVETGQIKPNERILLLGIGSGLSTLMLGILWQ